MVDDHFVFRFCFFTLLGGSELAKFREHLCLVEFVVGFLFDSRYVFGSQLLRIEIRCDKVSPVSEVNQKLSMHVYHFLKMSSVPILKKISMKLICFFVDSFNVSKVYSFYFFLLQYNIY